MMDAGTPIPLPNPQCPPRAILLSAISVLAGTEVGLLPLLLLWGTSQLHRDGRARTAKSEFMTAITQLAPEKGVPREMVVEAIESALVSAYKHDQEDTRAITAEIDSDSGQPKVYHWLTVVEDIPDDVEDDSNLIILEQARTLKSPEGQVLFANAQPGDQIYEDVTPPQFGRIAAQTAKQVVMQKLRDAERRLRKVGRVGDRLGWSASLVRVRVGRRLGRLVRACP